MAYQQLELFDLQPYISTSCNTMTVESKNPQIEVVHPKQYQQLELNLFPELSNSYDAPVKQAA
ncbi:hypothetical protein PN462_23035 [Spirulina sp. CS-785/01]|uniref:hypothetical protein n=1 Tax=Spirulina sp. CS-785/01 TaxID=3021716 RepID=UPI00232CA5F6|nr:hypothetical protein [Spirulina sp. CS-785/01]MDB9316004.1 hypothetical protein [Spirulina sp. CS-785/01]